MQQDTQSIFKIEGIFVHTNKNIRNRNQEKIPFDRATRKIKYLGINLTKEVKTYTQKTIQHWRKKIRKTQVNGNVYHVLWKTVWNFLRKLKMELPFDPAILLLGLYPKKPETLIQKNLCTPMFIAAQFTTAKCWKQPKCPSVNEWIKKLC